MSRRPGDIAAAVALGVIALAAWPIVSEWWLGGLRDAVIPLARGGAVYGPATASPAVPVVAAFLAALAGPWLVRVRVIASMVVTTFALEAVLVAVGALAGLPSVGLSVLGQAVQHVVPVLWLVVLLRRAPDVGSED